MTGKELLMMLQELPEESLAGEVVFNDYGDEYDIECVYCEIGLTRTSCYGEFVTNHKVFLSRGN